MYCSSVRSSKRRISAIVRNSRRAVSASGSCAGLVSAALAIGKTLRSLTGEARLTAMATPVTVPRLGDEMRSAVLIRFLVPAGGAVHRGDPLYELDTDKVTQEVEAEADGVLLRIDAAEGDEYPVGATLAWIGEPGEDLP